MIIDYLVAHIAEFPIHFGGLYVPFLMSQQGAPFTMPLAKDLTIIIVIALLKNDATCAWSKILYFHCGVHQ